MTNGPTRKIAIGVAVIVFAGLILSAAKSCRWMHDTLIRMDERSHK